MWNKYFYLKIAPEDRNLPVSLLFDVHAEELSFPGIYIGHSNSYCQRHFQWMSKCRTRSFCEANLHKLSMIDTGGLPYEITFITGKCYILNINIDVVDGLANRAVGKLCHIDSDQNGEISTVWLIFSNKVGRKLQKKYAGYIAHCNIDRSCTNS